MKYRSICQSDNVQFRTCSYFTEKFKWQRHSTMIKIINAVALRACLVSFCAHLFEKFLC